MEIGLTAVYICMGSESDDLLRRSSEVECSCFRSCGTGKLDRHLGPDNEHLRSQTTFDLNCFHYCFQGIQNLSNYPKERGGG